MLRICLKLALGLILIGVPMPAASQTPPSLENTLASPVASAFVNYVLDVLHNGKPSNQELQEECGMASEQNGDRVLVNDISVIAGKRINTKGLQGFSFACPLQIHHIDGRGTTVVSTASFQDTWGTIFDPARTAPASWTTDDGTVLHVPMMHGQATVVSEAKIGGLRVIGIPFREGNFAFFLVTGKNVTLDAARQYFASGAFKQKKGFRSIMAALSVPRVTLHLDRQACVGSCSSLTVKSHMQLSLVENGLGDAPLIPKQIELRPRHYPNDYNPCCAPPVNANPIVADRTFYFAIIDAQTSRTLFEALVRRPTLR